MKINVIVPWYPFYPSGGHKIMYQYANVFAGHGHDVMVYHVMRVPHDVKWRPRPYTFAQEIIFHKSAPKWMPMHPAVNFRCVGKLSDANIRDADVSMSTLWLLAEPLYRLSSSKGKKVNFIQGYENWVRPDIRDGLQNSYRLGMTNVVVSDFLADVVQKVSGERPHIVYNAIDGDVFNVTNEIRSRIPHTICMMYSEKEIKGSAVGMSALRMLREKYDDLKVDLFGVYAPPANLPDWVRYHMRPQNLPAIYNSNSIFFTPSFKEAWGLPATEAMYCGCALCCTNVEGHTVFAHDNETAVLCKAGDAGDMASKLDKLLNDDGLRVEIAERGNRFIQKFNWGNSYEGMVRVFSIVDNKQ